MHNAAKSALAAATVVPLAFFGVSAVADNHAPERTAIERPEPAPEPVAAPPAPAEPVTPAEGVLTPFLASEVGAPWEGTVTSLEVTGGGKGGATGYLAVADIPLYDLAVFDLCEDISTVFNGGDVTVHDPAGNVLAFPGADGICLLAGTVVEYPLPYGPGVVSDGDPDPGTVAPPADVAPEVVPPAPPVTGPGLPFANCTEVWNAIGAPISNLDPGYGPHLDRDGDGTGCEYDPR